MDKLTLDRIKLLHPKVRDEVNKIYSEIVEALKGRAICRFAYTLRTFAEQDALYAQGRTKLFDAKGNRLGKVTNAKAGQSAHNYGLAVDIVLLVDKDGNGTYESAAWDVKGDYDKDGMADWMECIQIFKKYGWKWGGDWATFKDYPHVEKLFGISVHALAVRKRDGKVDKEGYVII